MVNKKIVDYVIICYSDVSRLQNDVLEYIKKGYVIQGGCCIGGGDYRNEYAQAMVKYEE